MCNLKEGDRFLGMIKDEKGVKRDMTKVEALMSWADAEST